MPSLLEALSSGRVLLMDGAMGTELQRHGLRPPQRPEDWNLDRPEVVRELHRAYVDAGAEVLLTNTFQANAVALADRAASRPGFVAQTFRAAAQIAADVAGPSRFVLADIGPIVGDERQEFADLAALDEVIQLASEAGLAGILFETCSSVRVRLAVERARRSGCPILLSLSFRKVGGEYATLDGHAPEWFAERAADWGARALGVNCGPEIDVADCAAIVRQFRDATDLLLFARPNAGTPTPASDGWLYPHDPATMAAQLLELLDAGACMVGGCCGTTPAHIAAFRAVIGSWHSGQRHHLG